MSEKNITSIEQSNNKQLDNTGKLAINSNVISDTKDNIEDLCSSEYITKGILKLWKETPEFNRLYLLRHLPVLKCPELDVYERLKSLKTTWKDIYTEDFKEEDFVELERQLKVDKNVLENHINCIVINWSKDALIYWDNSWKFNTRVWQTLDWIYEEYDKIFCAIDLPWSDKSWHQWGSENKTSWDLNRNINEILSDNYWKDIIIIWNRSYAFSMDRERDDTKTLLKESQKEFERKWHNYLDFDENNKLIKPKNTYLEINYDNYEEIRKIFWINEDIAIKNLQNWVNNFFWDNPKLFIEYLKNNEIKNHDLHIFCLSNLLTESITSEHKEVIEKFLKYSFKNKTKQENIEIFKLLHWYKKIDEHTDLGMEYLLKIKLKYGWKISYKELWVEELEDEFEKLLKVVKKSNESVNSIYENSLDDFVNWEEDIDKKLILIDRKLNIYVKKTHEEIREEVKSSKWESICLYKKETIDLNRILKNSKMVNVLLSNVWEGKSICLSEMKEEVDKKREYFSIFYSSKDSISNNSTFESIKEQISSDIKLAHNAFPSKWIVVFFDGIDELNNEYKDDLKTFLTIDLPNLCRENNTKINIILWSRKSEFNEYWDDSFNTIWFENLSNDSIEWFLRSRLWEGDDNKLQAILEFLNWNILDNNLKHTPLILFLLTKISVDDLKEIKNRADLYKAVVFHILDKHQGKIWTLDSSDFSLMFNTLWFCAYHHFNNNSLTKDDIEDNWDNNNELLDYRGERNVNKRQEILNQIFLLYKIKDSWYSFILHSFQEYFLAEYLSKQEWWNEEIFNKRDESEENWNEWKEFKSVVLFYGEILINDWNFKTLENFLTWILDNDDIFWEWFFMGLEILVKLDEKYEILNLSEDMKNKFNKIINWLKIIYLWEINIWNENNILYKLKLLHDFQEMNWYKKNNYFNIELFNKFFTKLPEFYNEIWWAIFKPARWVEEDYGKKFLETITEVNDLLFFGLRKPDKTKSMIHFAIKQNKWLLRFWEYDSLSDIFIELINIWKINFIEESIKSPNDFIKSEKIDWFYLYSEIIKTKNENLIDEIIFKSIKLYKIWQENFLKYILMDLIEIWSKKYIEIVIDIFNNIIQYDENIELMNFIYWLQSSNIKIAEKMLNIQPN